MGRGFSSSCADFSCSAERPEASSREQLVAGLRDRLGRWGKVMRAEDMSIFSCGTVAIDRLIPRGGLRHGMVVEWIEVPSLANGSSAGGAATLGLLSAREACREEGVLVVIDRARTFYPPAAAAWGIDLTRLIVVWPQSARDELWAAVQSLRSPVVGAVWAPIERLDGRAFRRLQLAAETGRTLGVLVRPASARGQPSWADVRLEVESRARGLALSSRLSALDLRRSLQVRNTHCRGGRAGGSVLIEIDDANHMVQEASWPHDTHPLPMVTKLVDSTSHSHSARA